MPGKLTVGDYMRLPDDGIRYELIDGELHVTPAPKTRHQRLVGRVFRMLADHVDAHALGEVFVAPFDAVLSEHDVVQPDVVYVAKDDAARVTDDNLQGPPTLAVEVVSDSRRDRKLKRELYAAVGVLEYWIVDPDADRVEVYRLNGSTYSKPEIFVAGDMLATHLIPGLAIDVAALLER